MIVVAQNQKQFKKVQKVLVIDNQYNIKNTYKELILWQC